MEIVGWVIASTDPVTGHPAEPHFAPVGQMLSAERILAIAVRAGMDAAGIPVVSREEADILMRAARILAEPDERRQVELDAARDVMAVYQQRASELGGLLRAPLLAADTIQQTAWAAWDAPGLADEPVPLPPREAREHLYIIRQIRAVPGPDTLLFADSLAEVEAWLRRHVAGEPVGGLVRWDWPSTSGWRFETLIARPDDEPLRRVYAVFERPVRAGLVDHA